MPDLWMIAVVVILALVVMGIMESDPLEVFLGVAGVLLIFIAIFFVVDYFDIPDPSTWSLPKGNDNPGS